MDHRSDSCSSRCGLAGSATHAASFRRTGSKRVLVLLKSHGLSRLAAAIGRGHHRAAFSVWNAALLDGQGLDGNIASPITMSESQFIVAERTRQRTI
jgi:hypothetical protein